MIWRNFCVGGGSRLEGKKGTDVDDVDGEKRRWRGVGPVDRRRKKKKKKRDSAPVGGMGGATSLTTSNGGRARDQRGMAGGRPGGRGLWHGAHQ